MSKREESTRKPESEPDPEYVNIKVNGQDGSEVYFRVRKKTQLKKLMASYCQRQGQDQRIVAFLLDGHHITGNQTPEQLELKDGDEIDAMNHHGGGGGANCGFL
ncbi:small ubiquitin-related modifier 1-like [Momordica charantia]|uniref:Small ubiquitin-related modifier 1-like n=1 Tax=Momordica charantia TaxID=3673 RepID=A0A6J1D1W9_MOMCH|nr:small ubiquitin-related modifier 1-like [Momordica charantia]